MSFESTLPLGAPELMRVSAFKRYLDDLAQLDDADPQQLPPSLLQDLRRFEEHGRHTELLEVLAASMRHLRNVVVHMQDGERVLPLTLFPRQRLAHCPLPLPELLQLRLQALQVLHVEPAVLRPPGDPQRGLVKALHLYHPLPLLSWELSMRGAREQLLPEIAGYAAYRASAVLDLRPLPIPPLLRNCVRRLQRETTNLRGLSEWPGMDRALASRLLNALYLQAGLIVSRSHPAADTDGWF
ncbi:hypothetical protein [Azohydromonas lata]|uniref:Uncharacterized protein n=1 Tax=Azohydromonas lata TaxID=45677 RepID=A0ABU5IP67_9BURK|nr:hypothetical protein [Azohydromonas lata]MDZ5460680.1 hypothetical protein [Azohydromonas lata]